MAATGEEVLIMRIPRLRTSIAAMLAVAGVTAAVAVAAPTRTSGTTPIQRAIQQALQKTAGATSSHFAFTVSVTGAGTQGAIAISGTGGFDTKNKTGQFTINLGALSSLLGSASGGASIPKTLDVVVAHNTVYVHLPAVANQVQKGAEWLKFSSTSLPTSVTKTVNPSDLSKIDPQKALAQLTSSVTVHKVGTATVRGTKTTHYRVVVNTAKVVAILPKSQQAAEAKALKQLNVKTLNIEVYVSDSGYVRRVTTGVSHLVVQKGSPAVGFNVSIDLYDFGTPIKVTAPPASKTVDGAKLLKQLIPGTTGG
jgi:hypothetical protein